MFKAVYKSGFVTCSDLVQSEYHWLQCNSGYAFELKKNGAYVAESPSWDALPAECVRPTQPSGDILCRIPLNLVEGDKLTPTWYEVSHRTSVTDNDGTITIDLYGFREVKFAFYFIKERKNENLCVFCKYYARMCISNKYVLQMQQDHLHISFYVLSFFYFIKE